MITFDGVRGGTYSVSGVSRLGIGFAAGLGAACGGGGGPAELDDCDPVALGRDGAVGEVGLAFGGGGCADGYGCGGALYPGGGPGGGLGPNLLTLGAGTVGSGIVTHPGICVLGGSGGQTPSPNLNTFFHPLAATCNPGCPPPAWVERVVMKSLKAEKRLFRSLISPWLPSSTLIDDVVTMVL